MITIHKLFLLPHKNGTALDPTLYDIFQVILLSSINKTYLTFIRFVYHTFSSEQSEHFLTLEPIIVYIVYYSVNM